MRPKHLIFLSLVFALVSAAVAVRHFRKTPDAAIQDYVPLDLLVDIESVKKIEIEKKPPIKEQDEKQANVPEEKIPAFDPDLFTLVKEALKGGDEIWRISEYAGARANPHRVETLLKEINAAKGELRGQDAALWKDFGLDEGRATRLSLFDGSGIELLTLYLGDRRLAPSNIFIRKKDSDRVYIIDKDFLGDMGVYGSPKEERPRIDYWPARKLFHFSPEKVERLEAWRRMEGKELQTAGAVREVNPDDPAKRRWRYLREGIPFPLDAEKIHEFLEGLMGWHGTKALLREEGKDYGFLKPSAWMKMALEGEGELFISVGAKDETNNTYYLEISTEPVIYQFTDYYYQSLQIDDSRFFVKNPLEVSPEQTTKLVIAAPEQVWRFKPSEDKNDKVNPYLKDKLQTFSVERLLFDSEERSKVKSPAGYWIELQKEGGEPKILDVGTLLPGEKKEYASQMRDGTQSFAISEATFKKLFENLDQLPKPSS